ncbi:MerR family transcriptional regulator [Glycomyces sp. NPDC047010]|uniref:MerR family transcriptional regulator n=1 Tax=Glycomyces sp. NPDC047010 TaxID=3155023 RepID=UPI003409B818
MTNPDLMTICAFAQRFGLTAGALRFYADSGLLLPTEFDGVSGYRFYAPAQIERAVLVRRLRGICIPWRRSRR